jgi:hypothetical protein
MYYNNSGWDAATQTYDNFNQWWSQMYGDSDRVINLAAQSLNGASFHAVALWTIPQNQNNQSPLNAQLLYEFSVDLDGFVNTANSGDGHHELGGYTIPNVLPLPQWDLVAITRSGKPAV